jgi:hypothetical protein
MLIVRASAQQATMPSRSIRAFKLELSAGQVRYQALEVRYILLARQSLRP